MQPISEAEKIEGWMNRTELEWLREKALSMPAGSVAVALGLWCGRSVVAMAVDHTHLVGIDHFQGSPDDLTRELAQGRDIQAVFKANMRRLGINMRLIVVDAIDAAATFLDGSIQFLFMDTDNADFRRLFWAWYPKIAPDGVYSGHDYAPEFPNIQTTLRESGLYFWGVGDTSIWVIYKNQQAGGGC